MEKYRNLFEGIDLSDYTPQQIMDGKKLYDYIVECADIAKSENMSMDDVVDEGIFGALVGAAAGATIGTSIMKSVCKALGIDEKGTLGNLLTSKLVVAAISA